jgi:hypothetical protein
MRFKLFSRDPFVVHFPRKKKNKTNDTGFITLKANYFGMGVPVVKKLNITVIELKDRKQKRWVPEIGFHVYS